MDADRSHEDRLTGEGRGFGIPFFSPEGDRVLLSSTLAGKRDIKVIRADGSRRKRLTVSTGEK